MLKPEEIAKRVEAAKQVKPWLEARMDRLASCDPTTRSIGQLLLGYNEKGKRTADTRGWRRLAIGTARLKKLDAPELLRLGEALFPRDPDVFKAAWNLHERLPYQHSYDRKPFRAPNRPDLLLGKRREFLSSLLTVLEGFDQDLPWLAAHAPHIGGYLGMDQLGLLFAGAIDLGGHRGEEVEQVLRESASGIHDVGQMGRHVTTGFLCSKKPECWEFIEKLLLAAQRQEGLRQVILESIDFSHPDAFRRMLRVINDQNLVRFSSTVRAADVWLGMQLDSASARYVEKTLQSLTTLLDDEQARAEAVAGDDAEQAFLALWAIAFEDAPASIPHATELLRRKSVEMRFVAVHLLGMLGIRDAYEPVLPALDDSDLRVAVYGATVADAELKRRVSDTIGELAVDEDGVNPLEYLGLGGHAVTAPPKDSGDFFDRLAKLYERAPAKPVEPKPLVWPWMKVRVDRQAAADRMVLALGERSASTLLPFLGAMSPGSRSGAAGLLGSMPTLDVEARSTLVRLVGDPAGDVRETAVKAMKKLKIKPDDLTHLEPLLDRKTSDLRRSVLTLILSLKDSEALKSAARLMDAKKLAQRLAGLDLIQQMRDAGRSVDKGRVLAEAYRATHETLERNEQVYLDKLTRGETGTLTLDDAVGLMDPTQRTPPSVPRTRNAKLATPAALELIKLFDSLIHTHREDPVTLKTYSGDNQIEPLGAIRYGFPGPFEFENRKTKVRSLDELPLRELWFEAWAKRPKSARDRDGLEAVRALLIGSLLDRYRVARRTGWRGEVLNQLVGKLPQVKYPLVLDEVLTWLAFHETKGDVAGFVTDGFETLLAAIPGDKLSDKSDMNEPVFRDIVSEFGTLTGNIKTIAEEKGLWSVEHSRRLFGLMRWIDEPLVANRGQEQTKTARPAKPKGSSGSDKKVVPNAKPIARDRVEWDSLLEAFQGGWANQHDVFDHLLGPRPEEGYRARWGFLAVRAGTIALRRGELPATIAPLVQRALDRILEIELARGENETVVTPAAMAIQYAGGLEVLIRVLEAIGRDPKLQRTYAWGHASASKSAVFSHLIRVTLPGKDDVPEDFVAAVKAAGIDEKALLAVAFYAPQWARFVQAAVGWPLFEEAVWWFHAHTKDSNWQVQQDVRESWNAEIRKLTPLSLEDLTEGAVDVDWFHRTSKALGERRWARLDEFAKFASGGSGHKRAQLFAAAMLGKLKRADLVEDINEKRKQDSVRALGLLPLDKKSSKKDVLERYKLMQEFVRTSRQFGSQRQASEKLAARIGQENLARTAGYPDPVRLQWAMEGLTTADLARGPVTVTVKDLSVSLAVDAEGVPEITVKRGEKPLKSIPPELKKNQAVTELTERKTELRRSGGRMRQSLELAMCRGDSFSGESLLELMGNVILRPMLERLVFLGEGIAGYPVSGGKGLRDFSGKVEPVKKTEVLRLAHSADFLSSKQWTQWQRDCFATERVQPFKQVFRELYVLTEQEKGDASFSRRYAGHQVNPRQALALLGARGWVTAPEAGVFRTFHDEKLVAWIEFMESFYTPAEVEGLTLEKVRFARRGATELTKLVDVPPRLLSEVMRDVDLIVSVAHRGAVDPEASASTVELRSALVRETTSLLKLDNVKIKAPHVFIKGTLGEFSVHLGSATTQMMPGGTLFIVPVHSQHRGRTFLPFADDDPKTAEILSKVLLLARDGEIQDPNLLDQIRALR